MKRFSAGPLSVSRRMPADRRRYPVTTVPLARVLLHDRIARRQELGVCGALAGVALVTIAS